MDKPTSDAYNQMQYAFDYYNEELFDGKVSPCLVTFFRNKKSYGYYCKDRFSSILGGKADEIALNISLFAVMPIEEIFGTLVHEMAHAIIENSGHSSRKCYHNTHWSKLMESIGLMPSATGIPGGARVGQTMSHYILPNGKFEEATRHLIKKILHINWYDRYVSRRPEGVMLFMKQIESLGASGEISPIPAMIYAKELDLLLPSAIDRSNSGITNNKSEAAQVQKTKTSTPGKQKYSELDEEPFLENKSNRIKYRCAQCKLNVWGKHSLNVLCGECGNKFIPVID